LGSIGQKATHCALTPSIFPSTMSSYQAGSGH
jgi:hypothetical protein